MAKRPRLLAYSTGFQPVDRPRACGKILPMARPKNVPLQGHLVRELRDQLALNQEQLVTLVYRALPDGDRRMESDGDTLARLCREWENGGRISLPHLKALGRVLGVSTRFLQEGGPPESAPSRIQEIASHLKEQCAQGNETALQFVAQARTLSELGGIPPLEGKDDVYRAAAEAVEVRLGSAQLTGDKAELEVLGRITGWGRADLLKPASVHGYWLVHSESQIGGVTELVRGVRDACRELETEVARWLESGGFDSTAVFEEEAPWFRLHLKDPPRPNLDMTISFVRCEPTESGLTYVRPTEQERWHLLELQASDLERRFNYVRALGDDRQWPRFEDMRLGLFDVRSQHGEAPPAPVALFSGCLQEHLHRLPSWVGEEHFAVMKWLGSRLAQDLAPYLSDWPRECWKVSTSKQTIKLLVETPSHVARKLDVPLTLETCYVIQLIEVLPGGQRRSLPWADRSVALIVECVESAIAALPRALPADLEFVGPRRPDSVWGP